MIIQSEELHILEMALGLSKDSDEASIAFLNENPELLEQLDDISKDNANTRVVYAKNSIDIIDRILGMIVEGEALELKDEKDIDKVVSCIKSYMHISETEALEQIKEDALSDVEIEEYRKDMQLATDILGKAGIKNHRDDLESFLKEIELLTDQEEISFTLKKTELQAILDVLHHVKDHNDWMYQVFNGSALRSGHKKLSEAMEVEE